MFDKVPFYAQVLIFLAMAAGIVLVAYAVYPNLGQMQEEITKLEDEYAVKEAKIREGQAIEQRLPEFEREIEFLPELEPAGSRVDTRTQLGDPPGVARSTPPPG